MYYDSGASLYVRFDDGSVFALPETDQPQRYELADAAITGLTAGNHTAAICVGSVESAADLDEIVGAVPSFVWNGTSEVTGSSLSSIHALLLEMAGENFTSDCSLVELARMLGIPTVAPVPVPIVPPDGVPLSKLRSTTAQQLLITYSATDPPGYSAIPYWQAGTLYLQPHGSLTIERSRLNGPQIDAYEAGGLLVETLS